MVATPIFFIFTPKIGEDEPILTSIFFKGVGSTTNQFNYETSSWPRASGLSEMDGFLYLRNIAGAMLSALASVLSLIFGTLDDTNPNGWIGWMMAK